MRAQLTISQPSENQIGGQANESGSQFNADPLQRHNDPPITIVYEWKTSPEEERRLNPVGNGNKTAAATVRSFGIKRSELPD